MSKIAGPWPSCPQTGWEWSFCLPSLPPGAAPEPILETPRPPPRRAAARLCARLAELRRQHPGKLVELWAEDEARLGLKPITRRVWAVRGHRPQSYGRTKYQWTYVYGFVHPASGRNLELLLPAANADWMGLALEEFARWADPQGSKLLVLLVDNAGWHVAKRLVVPANVVLHRLPPYTPQLQPAEPLWPLVREVVANVGFDDLAAAKEPVFVRRCRWLIDRPEVVRGVVGFQRAVEPVG